MNKFKYLIIGAIIGTLASITMPTAAAVQQYILYQSNYKTLIDGKEYKNTDYPVLSFKGETYAPVGEITSALGIEAEIITKNKTINFKKNVTPETKPQSALNISSIKIPSYKLGETAIINGVEVTLNKLEYINNTHKGFQISFSIKNNTSHVLENYAYLKFKLSDSKYESEANKLSRGVNVDKKGFLYPNETVTGTYFYSYTRDINIKEILYSNELSNGIAAKWITN